MLVSTTNKYSLTSEQVNDALKAYLKENFSIPMPAEVPGTTVVIASVPSNPKHAASNGPQFGTAFQYDYDMDLYVTTTQSISPLNNGNPPEQEIDNATEKTS